MVPPDSRKFEQTLKYIQDRYSALTLVMASQDLIYRDTLPGSGSPGT